MITYVNVLVRREEFSHEEFRERWRGDHADLARDLPGLRRYATSVPTDPGRSEYDGIVELAFEDRAALRHAFDSEIGQELQTDAAEFVDPERSETLIVDRTVHANETG